MRIFSFCIAIAFVLLSACTSVGQVEREAGGPKADEAFIVIGVSSPDYRVIAFSGVLRDGYFLQTDGPAIIAGTAQDGYLVGRAKPGQSLAITVVEFLRMPNEIYGKGFYACKDAKAMVFQVPSQGVYYLGDIDYAVAGKTLRVSYTDRRDSAQAYLSKNYPNVRGDIQILNTTLLPVAGGYCDQVTYVPIYIGGGRR